MPDNSQSTNSSPELLSTSQIEMVEINVIDNFISNTSFSLIEDKAEIDTLCLVNNNDNEIVGQDYIEDSLRYFVDKNNTRYNTLDVAFRNIATDKNTIELFHDTITNSFLKFNNIYEDVAFALKQKQLKVSTEKFEYKLYNFLFSGSEKHIFSNNLKKILFYNNKLEERNIIETTSVENSNILNTCVELLDSNTRLNNKFFTECLLMDISTFNLEENSDIIVKSLRNTEVDIFTQAFLNFSRSLYTLSHNCLLHNVKDQQYSDLNSNFLPTLNLSNDSLELKNLIPSFDLSYNSSKTVFNYINTSNEKFVLQKYFEMELDPYLESNYLNRFFGTSNIHYSHNHIEGLDFNGEAYLGFFILPSVNSFISKVMIENQKNKFFFSSSDLTLLKSSISRIRQGNTTESTAIAIAGKTGGSAGSNPANLSTYIPTMFRPEIIIKINQAINGEFFDISLGNVGKSLKNYNLFLFDTLYKEHLGEDYSVDDIRRRNESNIVQINGGDVIALYMQNFLESYYTHSQNSGSIYYQNKPIINTVYTKNEAKLYPNYNFELDYSSAIDVIKTKQKIDSFLKSVKIMMLKKKGVNLKPFKDVIEKVKKTKNTQLMLSFCEEDTENIAVIDKNSNIFNLLFSSKSGEYYSYSDIVGKKIINEVEFKSFTDFTEKNFSVDSEREKEKENIENLISNYYLTNSSFLNSSSFFYDIVKSVIESYENSIDQNDIQNSSDETDVNNVQALYFNYLKSDEIDNDVYTTIIRRFFEKAIQLDFNSSDILRRSKNSPNYSYDIDNIILESYNEESLDSIKQYQTDILNSSQALRKIKNSVYNLKNIEDISHKNNYTYINGIGTVNYFTNVTSSFSYGSIDNSYISSYSDGRKAEMLNLLASSGSENVDFSSYRMGLSANMVFTPFPGYTMFYPFRSNRDIQNDSQLSFKIKTKNKIDEKIENNTTFYYIKNEKGNDSFNSYDFDVTNSKNIKIKLTPELCNSDDDRKRFLSFSANRERYQNKNCILIEDIFDECCKLENTMFSKVIQVIQDFLRISVEGYEDKNFNTFAEISTYIENNKDIFSYIGQILDLYATFYLPVYNRVQRAKSLKIFSHITTDASAIKSSKSIVLGGSNVNAGIDGILAKNKNYTLNNASEKFYNTILTNQNGIPSNILTRSDIDFLIYDIKSAVLNRFVETKNIDLDQLNFNLSESQSNNFGPNINARKSKLSMIIESIYKSLLKSDIVQCVNLDIIGAYIKHQENISKNISEIMSIEEFKVIGETLGENISNNISKNFYNDLHTGFYLKKLFEISKYSKYYNKKINNIVGSGQIKNIDAYRNYNLFSDQKNINKYFIENSQYIKDNSENNDFFFSERGFSYNSGLNSNIISLGLSNKILDKKNTDSLVKVSVKIVDLENIHHLYLPKIYLFATSISNSKCVNNVISEENNATSIKDLLCFNSNLSIDSLERVFTFNPDDYKISFSGNVEPVNYTSVFNSSHPLYVLINRLISKNRINVDNINYILTETGQLSRSQTISILCNHILNCHTYSKYTTNMSKTLTGINLPSTENNDYIHREFLNVVNQMPTDLFKNTFSVEKSQFISSYEIDSESGLFKQSAYDFKNKNATLFLESLNSICPISNLHEREYFDIYNIVINPSDFVFFDLNKENTNNPDDLFSPFVPNSSRVGFNPTALNSVLLNNFTDINFDGLMSNFQNQYYLKNTNNFEKVKNYKIYIEGEVI